MRQRGPGACGTVDCCHERESQTHLWEAPPGGTHRPFDPGVRGPELTTEHAHPSPADAGLVFARTVSVDYTRGFTGQPRPKRAARPPAGWLLLWCLQHPGIWVAPGASSSAGGPRGPGARFPRFAGHATSSSPESRFRRVGLIVLHTAWTDSASSHLVPSPRSARDCPSAWIAITPSRRVPAAALWCPCIFRVAFAPAGARDRDALTRTQYSVRMRGAAPAVRSEATKGGVSCHGPRTGPRSIAAFNGGRDRRGSGMHRMLGAVSADARMLSAISADVAHVADPRRLARRSPAVDPFELRDPEYIARTLPALRVMTDVWFRADVQRAGEHPAARAGAARRQPLGRLAHRRYVHLRAGVL